MIAFALTDDSPDCDDALQILAAAGIQASAEGSRVGGYILFALDPLRAQSVNSQALRYRTGDLRILLLQHPRDQGSPWHPDDVRQAQEWRRGLRHRDPANENHQHERQ